MSQQTTRYPGVYKDETGKFFYQTELGIDRVTGKRVRKKGRKDHLGTPFSSARAAHIELTRVKREYHKINCYANYQLTYRQFMETIYIPFYRSNVQENTFQSRESGLKKITERFKDQRLRDISLEDVQYFRTFLLLDTKAGGLGYTKSYAAMIFSMFRRSLDFAAKMGYLDYNISKKIDAIPRSKPSVSYWTKTEFQRVISTIYLGDTYEHLCFVMLWVYFMTGVRVNEGCALLWNDVDFEKGKLRVHHMLIIKNKRTWKRNPYGKTVNGRRVISLDSDTLEILKQWKEVQSGIGLGSEKDFIFSYDGFPMVKPTISNIIKRYAILAGVHPIQIKGLRHSHASYLINEFNVSVLILSKRMGHSSPDITLKHYSHMWTGADEAIVEDMAGNIIFDKSSQSHLNFNGNRAVEVNPTKNPTKMT